MPLLQERSTAVDVKQVQRSTDVVEVLQGVWGIEVAKYSHLRAVFLCAQCDTLILAASDILVVMLSCTGNAVVKETLCYRAQKLSELEQGI